MVAQYQALALGPQSSCQPFTFFLAEDNASKLAVHSLGVAVKVRHVLVDHVELARKSAPCLARLAVAVACGSHVGPRLVHRRVYEEARGIGGARRVAAYHVAAIVDQHHVGRLHGRKVFAEWVRPKCMRVLEVAHRYVSRHALGEAFPRKDTKGACPLRWQDAKSVSAPTTCASRTYMCESIHARCLSWSEKSGMPGRQTPCEMAWRAVFSLGWPSVPALPCLDCGDGTASTETADGAIVVRVACGGG
jgi:hypothetical protein